MLYEINVKPEIQVTVIVRDAGECSSFKRWSGEVNSLSPFFTDGTSTTGYQNSVTIVETENQAVEIRLRYLQTTIKIRQVSNSFM